MHLLPTSPEHRLNLKGAKKYMRTAQYISLFAAPLSFTTQGCCNRKGRLDACRRALHAPYIVYSLLVATCPPSRPTPRPAVRAYRLNACKCCAPIAPVGAFLLPTPIPYPSLSPNLLPNVRYEIVGLEGSRASKDYLIPPPPPPQPKKARAVEYNTTHDKQHVNEQDISPKFLHTTCGRGSANIRSRINR